MNSFVVALVAQFFSMLAFAVVDMKNANYANSWTDLELPGTGYSLKVDRGYNSRSLFEGMFGFGWCSDFETRISIMPEGSLKLTECGAGQVTNFFPREFSKKEIDETIKQISEKMKTAGKLDSKTVARLSKEMVSDNSLRAKYAQEFAVQVAVKEGTKFYANGSEVESIAFAKGVYTRTMSDGSSQRFNNKGLLTHLYDKNGNYLKFDYQKDLIREVVDNMGRKLSFKHYPNKKVRLINGPSGLSAEYKYSAKGDLVWVKNGWKNVYNYTYDDYHNLTKATYPDGTFIAISYDTKNDWVTGFTDREKCKETYKYEYGDKDPKMHYWSTVKKVCGKEVVNESKHEFWYKNRADGQVYLEKVASTINGTKTEIVYHEVFGRPIHIQRGNVKNSFEYYPNGQVKVKAGQFAKLSFKYHENNNKVKEVITEALNEKGKVVNTRKTNFDYDKKGNLTEAKNSDGQIARMTYDVRGRIATITDQSKKVVKIQYEEKYGRPAIVTRPGLGSIKVSYRPSGEIDRVNSAEGPSVALQVASSFNNLLEIISPATAEIYN